MQELSPTQERAANLVAAGRSNLEVAEECNISERTILRWKRLEAFQKAVQDYTTETAAAQFERLLDSDDEEVERHRRIESEQLDTLDSLTKKLGVLCVRILDASDPQDISPRALPALLKAFTGLIECRQLTADRSVGMDRILQDLQAGEAWLSQQISDNN